MTLEDILGYSADELEKLSDKELLAWAEPFLKITRPELAVKPEKGEKIKSDGKSAALNNSKKKLQETLALAKQLGLKLPEIK